MLAFVASCSSPLRGGSATGLCPGPRRPPWLRSRASLPARFLPGPRLGEYAPASCRRGGFGAASMPLAFRNRRRRVSAVWLPRGGSLRAAARFRPSTSGRASCPRGGEIPHTPRLASCSARPPPSSPSLYLRASRIHCGKGMRGRGGEGDKRGRNSRGVLLDPLRKTVSDSGGGRAENAEGLSCREARRPSGRPRRAPGKSKRPPDGGRRPSCVLGRPSSVAFD
jgi:hypothetical protein